MDVKLKLEEITGRPCIVQRYMDVTHQRLRELRIAALVISGNATPWSTYDLRELAGLQDIIRKAPWPILGLCGGLQLIAMAHGSNVGPMGPLRPGEKDVTTLTGPGLLKEWGYLSVDVIEPDPIFDGLGASPVFLQVHYCEVKELAPGFRVLASSGDCQVQVLKQLERPVYSTQFHSESYAEGANDRRNPLVNLVYPNGYPDEQPDGRRLLLNFFRIAGIVDAGKLDTDKGADCIPCETGYNGKQFGAESE